MSRCFPQALFAGLLLGLFAGPAHAQVEEPAEAPEPEGEARDADDEADAGAEPPPEAPQPSLVPPRLVHSEPPSYPPDRIRERLHPSVVVQVVLDEHGHVVEARVEHSAGEDFDREAVRAVERWTFEPARRGETPIPSRIRVSVHFALPGFDLAGGDPIVDLPTIPHAHEGSEDHEHGVGGHEGVPDAEDADPEESATEPEPEELNVEAFVDRDVRTMERGAGAFRVERDMLQLAPGREGADVLRHAPGVYVARPEGDAVGHRIMLRGFDAEHGQDLELRVGGLPINLPSHIHGQGYADLGFLIGEVVDELRVTEGVSDPAQGDFAVAGSIDVRLGVRQRGWRLGASYGSFNAFRLLGMWAPEGEARETFGAVQYRRTDGFGTRRAGESASAIVQGVFGRSGAWRFRGLAIVHGARSELAGLVRQDDVDSGAVRLLHAYSLSTAQAQSALNARVLVGLGAEYAADGGATGDVGIHFSYDTFNLQENFTGFDASGRGNLISQHNGTASVGLSARYRTEPYRPWSWARGTLELGLSGRVDIIDQSQDLVDADDGGLVFEQQVDASVASGDIGLFGDIDLGITEYVSLRIGARGDLLHYDVNDRVGTVVTRPTEPIGLGYRRSAIGMAAGPRVSLEVRPIDWLALRAAYGEGYRSAQARTLDGDQPAPFTKVRSADLGARFSLDRLLTVTLSGYWTGLSEDVLFEAREGALEPIGATQRLGAVLHAEARPLPWLRGAFSLTYVHATLVETGDPVPYVPPVVLRADLGASGVLVDDLIDDLDLTGRVGAGLSYLGPRPLPEGGAVADFALLDASAGIGLGPVELGVEAFNLMDVRYANTVFQFESNWSPTGTASMAQHASAGAPFTILGTVKLSM